MGQNSGINFYTGIIIFFLSAPAIWQYIMHRMEGEKSPRQLQYEKDKQLLEAEPDKWYDTGSRIISIEKRDMQLDYEPPTSGYPSPRASNYY